MSSDIPDNQNHLIDAVGAALTEHAEMHGTWILLYEEQLLSGDGEVETAITQVADGSPTARIGMLTVAHRRELDECAEEEGR